MNTTLSVDDRQLAGHPQWKLSRKLLKRAALLVILISGLTGFKSVAYGQHIHYRFQLQGVNDPGGAKMVTDLLRPVFNTQESPFEVFPAFNDVSDQFDFYASLTVTKEQLESVLTANGILLLQFSDTDKVELKSEER